MKNTAIEAVRTIASETVQGVAQIAVEEGVALDGPDILEAAWLLGLQTGLTCGITDVAAARRILGVIVTAMAGPLDRKVIHDVVAEWSDHLLTSVLEDEA